MSPFECRASEPTTPRVPFILLALTAATSIGCGPRRAPAAGSPDRGPPSIGRSREEARCALQLLNVCREPDEAGTIDLCGIGPPPAIGARYVLFDGHRVRDDIGVVIIRTVSGEDFEHKSRATATTSRAWLDADEWALGAIGPWDDTLDLTGGKVVWGDLVTEVGVWTVGLTLAFPRGERFELRGQLESCYRLLLETRFSQDGGSCITGSSAGPNEPISRRAFFVGVPRMCAADDVRPPSPP